MAENKWVALAKMLLPMVLPMVEPKLAPIAPQLIDAVADAELLFDKTQSGPQKLEHVKNLVKTGLNTTDAVSDKVNLNEADLDSALNNGVSTAVSVINLIHGNASQQ